MIFYTFITNNIIKRKCEIVVNLVSYLLQHAKYLSIEKVLLVTSRGKLKVTSILHNFNIRFQLDRSPSWM